MLRSRFISLDCVGHPFKGDAKALWFAFDRSFFWSLWCEGEGSLLDHLLRVPWI